MMGSHNLWTDEDMLLALHLVDNEGLTCQQASDRLGRPKNSVVGMVHRVKTAVDKADLTPELNGTMPEKWWQR